MSLNKNTKNSEDILAEVKDQANTLQQGLKGIEGRLTPGQLLDDLIFYPQGGKLSSTYDHLKQNPVGSLFLGLGTLMLVEQKNHTTIEQRLKNETSKDLKKAKAKMQEAAQTTKEKMENAGEKLMSARSTAKSSAKSKVEEISNKAKSKDFMHDIDPFAIAAIGLGIGTGIGHVTPIASKEKELMQSDQLTEDINQALKQSGERLKNCLIDELKNIHFQ